MIESILIKASKRFGWVIARQSTINRDAAIIHQKALKIGREIGILDVLRYNQKSLSAAKFKESAAEFEFSRLDAEYPYNPVLDKQNG